MEEIKLVGPATKIIEELKRIKSLDTFAEAKKKRSLKGMGCGLAIMTLGTTIMIPLGPLMPVSFLVGLVTIVAFIFQWWQWNKRDCENTRQDALTRLHQFLSQDADPKADFHYGLDFRSHKDKAFLLRKDPSKMKSENGVHKTLTISHFKQALLSGKVRLRDGSRISLALHRRSRVRDIKKSCMGKTKWYSRESFNDIVSIAAQLPPARYGTLGGLRQRLESTPLLMGKLTRVAVEGNIVRLTVVGPSTNDPAIKADPLLQTLVWLFRALRQEKALTCSAAGPAPDAPLA